MPELTSLGENEVILKNLECISKLYIHGEDGGSKKALGKVAKSPRF